MVFDPASYITNLLYYYCQNKQLKDLQKARPFADLFCFKDDLYAINDYLKFDKNYKDIYSPDIKLKRESVETSEVSFSELYIIIEKKENYYQLHLIKEIHVPFL